MSDYREGSFVCCAVGCDRPKGHISHRFFHDHAVARIGDVNPATQAEAAESGQSEHPNGGAIDPAVKLLTRPEATLTKTAHCVRRHARWDWSMMPIRDISSQTAARAPQRATPPPPAEHPGQLSP